MNAHHLHAGARARLSLVLDDVDRHDLVDSLDAALGGAILAYCVMDTHLHVVAEGDLEEVRGRLERALSAYARAFNRRHSCPGELLRGPVDAQRPIADSLELARAIRYVHENPLKTRPPLCKDAVDYRWSSQRAFSGLSLARVANVERALELLEAQGAWVVGRRARLVDLEPSLVPSAHPDAILEAAADTYGLPAWELAGNGRSGPLLCGRALYLALGRIEGWDLVQLAPTLNRSRSRASRVASRLHVPDADLRVARTVLRSRPDAFAGRHAAQPVGAGACAPGAVAP